MVEKEKLKKIIIDIIKDEDINIEKIKDDTELIGENGIFFDSIDVLELIVQIEKNYGIKIKDNDLIQEKFKNFETLYNFIVENEKK